MAKIGSPKSILFSNDEIPRDNPETVTLKTEFKSGETIWFRAYFEKTFAQFMQSENAVGFIITAYAKKRGKFEEIAHDNWQTIDKDMLTWQPKYLSKLSDRIQTALKALPKGKNQIKLTLTMVIPTPGAKDNVVVKQGDYLQAVKLVSTINGTIAASDEFTFVN